MARPLRKGLIYFNIDANRYQNTKIKRLKHSHGVAGLAVYDYVLCQIYGDEGCYLEWDDVARFNVTEYLNVKETLVQEIIKYCAYVGLFDKELLSRGIITSVSIQERYIFICKNARRKGIDKLIPPEISLIK